MIKYPHPSITIQEPGPGFYIISGHQPQKIFIEGRGHLLTPPECIIPPEVPADLLRALADARDGVLHEVEIETQTNQKLGEQATTAEFSPHLEGQGSAGETAAASAEPPFTETPPTDIAHVLPLAERLVQVLAAEGKIQIARLAERLEVSVDEIKALDAESAAFQISRAGWVKLNTKEVAV